MRRLTLAIRLSCILLIFASTAYPQSSNPAPSQPAKDPAAVSLLNQMVAATGWSSSQIPKDAIAIGTVSNSQSGDSTPANFTLKVKTCSEYRIDTEGSNGPTSLIINGDGGAVQTPAETDVIPPLSANSMQPLVLAFFCDLGYFADPNVSVSFVGTESVSGQPANKIQITRLPAASNTGAVSGPLPGGLTVWISAANSLPVQISWSLISDNNPAAKLAVTTFLSDYRTISGIAVPLHQEQQAAGSVIHELQLNSVTFNNGLDDSIFALPTPTQQ